MCVLKYDGDWKYADAVFLLLQQMVFISFSLALLFSICFSSFAFFFLLLHSMIQFLDHLTYIVSVYVARSLSSFFLHTY